MVFSKITRLTDASGVEFAVGVLTLGRHLVASFAVVAVLAHARGVVDAVNVWALRDLVSVLHFLFRNFLLLLCGLA